MKNYRLVYKLILIIMVLVGCELLENQKEREDSILKDKVEKNDLVSTNKIYNKEKKDKDIVSTVDNEINNNSEKDIIIKPYKEVIDEIDGEEIDYRTQEEINDEEINNNDEDNLNNHYKSLDEIEDENREEEMN